MDTISAFTGVHAFLSNFCESKVVYDGRPFPTIEHAYQYAKTDDSVFHEKIVNAETPGQAKRLGREAPLKNGWDDVKLYVMLMLLRQKFSDSEFSRKLLDTGEATLIEGNTWGDVFWGCVWVPGWEGVGGEWVGRNYLGKMLMSIRDQLRSGQP